MYARKVDDSLASEQGYLPPRTPAVALALFRLLRTRTTLRAAHRCLQLGPRAEVALILALYIPMLPDLQLGNTPSALQMTSTDSDSESQ